MIKYFILLIALTFAFSVKVTLKNGKVYNGEIISQNSARLILKTDIGHLTFSTLAIESINYDKGEISAPIKNSKKEFEPSKKN